LEQNWLSASDSSLLLGMLEKPSQRKLRLFTVGCCRRVWQYLDNENARPAIEAAEQCADGCLTEGKLWSSYSQIGLDVRFNHSFAERNGFSTEVVSAALQELGISMSSMDCHLARRTSSRIASIVGGQSLGDKADTYMLHMLGKDVELDEADHQAAEQATAVETLEQVALLRDIFSNPFQPVTLDPSWLASTVTALAHQMYESRDFGAMPILADALQDAGCENADILDHCRGPGPHVRGCWVVDLLLGKE
jgi:hypothetical protein